MKARNYYLNLLVVLMMLSSSACMLISSMVESPTPTPSLTATVIPSELPTQTRTPTSTATPLPTSTATSPPPTSTPTPKPILGIDVPIVIKNVSLQNSLGLRTTVDIKMKILDAMRRESLKSGDKPVLPEQGNIFLSLSLSLDESWDAIKWVVPNVTVNCGNNSYKALETVTIQFGKGLLQSWQVHYEVPAEADPGTCSAKLPDGRAIPLSKLFSGITGGAPPGAPANTQAPTFTSTPEPGRVYEPEGGYSYVPPKGWQIKEVPGFDFKTAHGAEVGGFFPNLYFYVNQNYPGTLDEYVLGSIEHSRTLVEDLQVISQEDFLTQEGQRGVKVVHENTQRNLRMRQAEYFFQDGARKFTATYSRLADKGQNNDILVDQSMKTFRSEAISGSPVTTPSPTSAVILIANPDCRAPKITSADEVIVRVRWGATTAQIAESNADQFTFVFLLDGQDKGDIRPYRQPAETYVSLKKYGCGSDESLAWVHWDVPIGRLPLGKHTISINYILDQAISDGMDEYPAGEFGFLEIPFEVGP